MQDNVRIMNKVPDGTDLTSHVWSFKQLILELKCQGILYHEISMRSILLAKVDIDKLRHREICTRIQIDHNTYDYSQYVILSHDASSEFH